MLALLAPRAEGAEQTEAKSKKGCSSNGVQMEVQPLEIKLACKEGYRNCDGNLPLRARNCTSEFLEVVKLEVYEHERPSMVLEFNPGTMVPPGGTWKEEVPWTTPGKMEAVVSFRHPGDKVTDAARAQIKVVNKALELAQKACERCKGTWGKYGINQNEGCNCRTADAGKVCHDGNECEGQCLFVQYDSNGREMGKCSDTKRVSGCVNIVQKGQSQLPPKLPPPRKLPTCLD